MLCRVVKKYTKNEVEVTNKNGKVKKHLPYYVLVCDFGNGKTLSIPIKPSFKESSEYAKLDIISEKDDKE